MIEQGSQEWLALRLGRVTASRVADVMARTKSGWGASRGNYMADLIAERLTGVPQEGYTNAAMQHGINTEPQARAAYAFMRDVEVELAGFVEHPKVPMCGCSPDGYVGAEGLVEIKCPSTKTHIETLLGSPIDDSYIKQMQFQMACTGRAWCDWVSFDPRLPAEDQLFIKRVPRDDALIEKIEAEVVQFLFELDAKLARLAERRLQAAA